MNGRRRLGVFLVIAGVLVMAGSGLLWRRHAPDLAKLDVGRAAFEDSLKRVHAELTRQSLLMQGLQASQSTLPDTVRRYGAGKMMEASQGYTKAIRKLEMTERDIKLEIASLKRDSERERSLAKRRTIPVAAAGAAVLVIGLVLTAIPGRRVGA